MHIPFNLTTLFLDIYLGKFWYIPPVYMHKNVYTSALCDSKVLEAIQMSINSKIDKYIAEKREYYTTVKISEL